MGLLTETLVGLRVYESKVTHSAFAILRSEGGRGKREPELWVWGYH